MEYAQEVLQLKQRIESIKALQLTKISNSFDESATTLRDNFVNALQEALSFSYYLEDPKDINYLKGINEALGSPENISQWMKNAQLLSKTCNELQQFINQHHPHSNTPASQIRTQALQGLLLQAAVLIIALAILALITFSIITLTSAPVFPIIILILFAGIFSESESKLPTAKADSRWALLFFGETKEDRVNADLVKSCDLFTNPNVEDLGTASRLAP